MVLPPHPEFTLTSLSRVPPASQALRWWNPEGRRTATGDCTTHPR